jgi:GDP-L-fucose synthase
LLLVTGSDGLIGSAIKRLYNGDAFYSRRSDGDLTDWESCLKLFKEIRPTHVIHAAALVGGIGGNIMKSGEYFHQNILMNTNVLEASRLANVENLVTFMSTCVFPETAIFPLTPDQLHNGQPHQSNFSYAHAKRMLDVQSKAYRKQWNVNFNMLIPPNVFGPHDNWNLQEGHVIPSLIHKFYLAKKNHQAMTVWGSGKPLREFMYSEDVARIALWAAFNLNQAEPLMVSPSMEHSISEVVEIIAANMNFEGPIAFDSNKPDGQFRKPSDTHILTSLLPDFQFTNISDGLRNTISWFEENYPKVRL